MRRGKYGFDAPGAFAGLVVGAVALLALAAISFAFDVLPAGIAFLLGGLYTLASAGSYAYTSWRGKFEVWSRELDDLSGDEHLLDLGCGRGEVLVTAARRLSKGRVTGVDRWRGSRESAAVTAANAKAEGVADRVDLVKGDPGALPFTGDSFDVVVSNLAIHEIRTADGRAEAVREAYRVLAPGGRLLIADNRHSGDYESVLRGLGAGDVRRRDLGWRSWYGGPWLTTWMVEAYKR